MDITNLVEHIGSGAGDDMCASAVTAFAGDINAVATSGEWKGWTPLMVAVSNSKRLTVSSVAARPDIDVNRDVCIGISPLYCAAYFRNRTVAVLLDAFRGRINVNRNDNYNGKTALHKSAEEGSKADVVLLLAAGADTRLKCKTGKTAEQCARDEGRHAVADLIAAHTAWLCSERRAWMAAVCVAVEN